MAEAGDRHVASAGGRGHLRAAHADREHVIGVLKTAFVRGMLNKDEFDQRVNQTFASRSYADLAAVTAGLPADLPAAVPLPAQAPAVVPEAGWLTMKRAVIISACLLVPTALATVIGTEFVGRYDDAALAILPFLCFFLATLISGPLIAEARRRQRSRPWPPRAPAPGARSRAVRESRARRPRRSTDRNRALAVTA
jgi:hypothetical protein